jgi:glycosyltransferase involved in cell wall biosynthesis
VRILWMADAGCHTGFATVTHSIGERLVSEYGHDVHVLANNYRGDYWPTNLKLYVPNMHIPLDLLGKSRYLELIGKLMPDAIFFINDPAIVFDCVGNNQFDEEKVLIRGIRNASSVYHPPMFAYMPIDGYNTPRSWDQLTKRMTRIAMTKFGRDTAMPEAEVVWHGVDTEVFKPVPKREAKQRLGMDPDRFLVLRVDKNSLRKDYPTSWKALVPLLREYDDIDVHFHCLPRANDGYDLNATRYNQEDVRARVTFSDLVPTGAVGWSIEQLSLLYSAADIFLSTSWGEGFGLTILEAMACGTPVIAQDCSAITEVVGPGGVLIPPIGRIPIPQGQEQCLPDAGAFTAAIRDLYLNRDRRVYLGERARKHALKFSWDYAAGAMNRIIEKGVSDAVRVEQRPPEGDTQQIRSVLVGVP